MDRQQLAAMAPSEIADAIGQLHAVMAATHATMLELIAAFDREEAWRGDGEWSMAGWLETALGVSRRTAGEWVRTARALEGLPAIARPTSGAGCRPRRSQPSPGWPRPTATRPWPRRPPAGGSCGCRRRPGVPGSRPRPTRHARTAVACTGGGRRTGCGCRATCPPRTGRWWPRRWSGSGRATAPTPRAACTTPPALADALVELASTRVANDAGADRATVVVHVDAGALAGGRGTELEDGPALPVEVARRLACDAPIEVVAEGPGGPLGIGRTRRQVPAWLGRQLRRRDQGCRFPGCSRTHHLQAHHVRHWAEGGPTDADNLVLVCGRHHRLVHERGWSITGSPHHGLTFVKPNGQPHLHGPPEMREELRERLGVSWGLATVDTS